MDIMVDLFAKAFSLKPGCLTSHISSRALPYQISGLDQGEGYSRNFSYTA